MSWCTISDVSDLIAGYAFKSKDFGNSFQNKVIKTYIDNIVGDIQTILETLTTVTSEGV